MKKQFILLTVCILVVAALALGACSAPAPYLEAPAAEAPAAAEDSYEPPVFDGGEQAPSATAEYEEMIPQEEYAYDVAPEAGTGSAESYIPIEENTEQPVNKDSVVTFSLKIDTASYTNVQRYIESWEQPPADAVKTEEMINYFSYDAPVRFGDDPFSIYTEVGKSPFDDDKYVAFIRVKAADVEKEELPPSSLTFLIDTSGSMDSYDKLPLLQESFAMLTDSLDRRDRVSIVTYAGSSDVVLDGASGANKRDIMNAIYNLDAGGSTAGAEGIWMAYRLAEKNFIPDGNNRVILATDGDFNVGISSIAELSDFISTKRDNGVYLSALGFGTDNLKDDVMETLSKDGDGNYNYINSMETAHKVLVDELGSNLFTIADDVKAQVEFNPENVLSYRLIGYENRKLNDSDFDDDAKDAGEIGVGTDVVVMFELELADNGNGATGTKYGGNNASEGATPQPGSGEYGNELFEVRIRYKDPGGAESKLITQPVTFDRIASKASSDFNFANAVAEFGQQLRHSDYAYYASLEDVLALAESSLGRDTGGYREEFIQMVDEYMAFY